MFGQHRVERLRLRHIARKAVENEPVPAIRLDDAAVDHLDDDIVGDELAGIHDGLDAPSELGVGIGGGAQHVAGGELDDAVGLLDPLRLCALPRAWRPEQDDVHPRRPLSFAFLISPSYWCANKCEWICATVSIVTLTTIRRLVPPK